MSLRLTLMRLNGFPVGFAMSYAKRGVMIHKPFPVLALQRLVIWWCYR